MHEVGGLLVLIWIISHTINLALKEKNYEGREFMTEA